MKAAIQADVRACDPPSLAVRVNEYTVTIAGPHTLGQLSRVDVIAREVRQLGTVEQPSLVVVQGTLSASPVPPALIHNLSVKQEPIAWVTVGPGQWVVRQEHIHTEWPPPRPDAVPDLAAWLLEQIAEDEQRARSALWVSNERFASGDLPFWERRYHVIKQIDERTPEGDSIQQYDVADCGGLRGIDAAIHILHWEPARVLAECDAKRRMIELLQQAAEYVGEWCGRCSFNDAPALKLMALPYADREGYREEWKP